MIDAAMILSPIALFVAAFVALIFGAGTPKF